MGKIASVLIRAAIVWWVIDISIQAVSIDHRANRLRKHITYLRSLNEHIGGWIIALENEHTELVS